MPLGISLGKSKVTPVESAVGDYLTSLRAVYPYADYIAVNVSSARTPRACASLQDRGPLDELLGALTAEAGSLAWTHRRDDAPVPVLVKIAPDLSDEAIGDAAARSAPTAASPASSPTNTTLDRHGRRRRRRRRWRPSRAGCPGARCAGRALEVVRFVTGALRPAGDRGRRHLQRAGRAAHAGRWRQPAAALHRVHLLRSAAACPS